MSSRFPLVLLLALSTACATSRPAPSVEPRPAPLPAPAASVAEDTGKRGVPSDPIDEPPRDWQLRDAQADGVPGIGLLRAERELLAGRQPRRTVVVAIIDGGTDSAHADLRANLWRNGREVAGNGRDDDGNGYADDVLGWNFIGGRDGRDVHQDTYELTRLHARCSRATPQAPLPTTEQARCGEIRAAYDKARSEAQQLQVQVANIDAMMSRVLVILRGAMGGDSVTPERVRALSSSRGDVRQARDLYLQLAGSGITPAVIEETGEAVATQLEYNLNTGFDPRPIVGDDTTNLAERRYGNADVMGPDARHGSHVAGIIGAVRANAVGIDGVAPAVQLMTIRAVPDGDERDKDIANAIRYAADNGAHVINMSFGKAYSPDKAVVDEAVKYADAKGVLMVHAAGNDGEDVGERPSFPTPFYATGGRAANWIEVGAASWKGGDSLAASFSNYGDREVDVFAPGVDILSTVPNGSYERLSGTSMAAPVVTGLAALLMAYHPELTAADVKRIILESATRVNATVARPGDGARVPFATLSVTGAVVNAHAALRMAQQGRSVRP